MLPGKTIARVCFATWALLGGCVQRQEAPLTIAWSANWNDAAVTCDTTADGFRLEDLRLFVHDVALVDAQGKETAARFVADGQWQTDRVALIDFAPDCSEGRNRHAQIDLIAPAGAYSALKFKLGVPFDLNHANAAVAQGPLAIGAMNWGWQGGYKFLKLEGKLNDVPFRIHLGSTECGGTIGHITGCNRPNRPEITVPLSSNNTVMLDLKALVGSELKAPSNCMGEAVEACEAPYAALGMNLKTGTAAGGQHAFLSR